MSVVLPPPFGPRIAVRSAGRTSKSPPRRPAVPRTPRRRPRSARRRSWRSEAVAERVRVEAQGGGVVGASRHPSDRIHERDADSRVGGENARGRRRELRFREDGSHVAGADEVEEPLDVARRRLLCPARSRSRRRSRGRSRPRSKPTSCARRRSVAPSPGRGARPARRREREARLRRRGPGSDSRRRPPDRALANSSARGASARAASLRRQPPVRVATDLPVMIVAAFRNDAH